MGLTPERGQTNTLGLKITRKKKALPLPGMQTASPPRGSDDHIQKWQYHLQWPGDAKIGSVVN